MATLHRSYLDWLCLFASWFLLAWAANAQPSVLLDKLAGRDLLKEDRSGADWQALHTLLGDIPKGASYPPVPWRLWKIAQPEGTRYLVLMIEGAGTIPGGTTARAQILGAGGERIGGQSFQTGWRNVLTNAALGYSSETGTQLLTIESAPVVNGRDIAKEFFAVTGDRVCLVRLENPKGRIVQNEYMFPNYEIGTVPEAKTIDEWAAMLASREDADVLSALVFLGGLHFDWARTSSYAPLFLRLIENARIQTLIADLANSSRVWIRQAAELARRAPRERGPMQFER